MPQQLPRIAKGFHLEVAIKIFCLGLIPLSAAIFAANRQQTLKEADILQSILTAYSL